MKKFLRIISTEDEYHQIKTRMYLNALGFYVLSLPNNMLEVNVIKDNSDWLDRLMLMIIGGN